MALDVQIGQFGAFTLERGHFITNDPPNGKNTGANLAKKVNLWVHFRSTSSIFGLLVLEKKMKVIPHNSLND